MDQGFSGTIAGMTVGNSLVAPKTTAIDLANTTVTSASLNATTDVLTIITAGGTSTLQLSGTYASGTTVGFVGDGAGGTDLFLVSYLQFHASGPVDSWTDPASWGGGQPHSPAAAAH